jgi:hypothetical protein
MTFGQTIVAVVIGTSLANAAHNMIVIVLNIAFK